MSSVNKVILLGRTGKDPESRTAGNNLVVNFSLATSKSWKDKDTGERKEKAEWHKIGRASCRERVQTTVPAGVV